MKVTLRLVSHDPADQGRYLILRGPDRFAWPGGPLVLSTFTGWEVVADGGAHKWFRRMAEARAWLNSDAGQLWLDGLPKETP